MVRTKNTLAVLMQVLAIVCPRFDHLGDLRLQPRIHQRRSLNNWIGGFPKAFLAGVTAKSLAATFSNGVALPEFMFIAFQMTFACITPALIVGAFAERIKFPALLLFVTLWVTFVYFPIAHMVWYWAGPDALGDAAAAVAAATDEAKVQATAALEAATLDAGQIFQWGAIDFAGGTVVHINVRHRRPRRRGADRQARRLRPRGDAAALADADDDRRRAAVGRLVRVQFRLEPRSQCHRDHRDDEHVRCHRRRRPRLDARRVGGEGQALGCSASPSGVVAGLVAVTPAAGFAGPMGSIVLGLVAGVVCFMFCTSVKNALGYDDSLDVFGVHCIGGIIGALGTGILVNPDLGGTGILDYTSKPGEAVVAAYDLVTQLTAQAKAVGVTLLWSGIVSLILYKIVDVTVGLRPVEEKEREGLDLTEHGERAYNY